MGKFVLLGDGVCSVMGLGLLSIRVMADDRVQYNNEKPNKPMKYSNVLPPNVVAPVVYVSVVSTLHNIKSLANSSYWATGYVPLWVWGSCLFG